MKISELKNGECFKLFTYGMPLMLLENTPVDYLVTDTDNGRWFLPPNRSVIQIPQTEFTRMEDERKSVM